MLVGVLLFVFLAQGEYRNLLQEIVGYFVAEV